MKDPDGEATLLRITYYGLDSGREFTILLNGKEVSNVSLKGVKGDMFYDVDYPIPQAVKDQVDKGILKLRFEAKAGSIAGGIYGIRLLKADIPQA